MQIKPNQCVLAGSPLQATQASAQLPSGDDTEMSLISSIKANVDRWRKMTEMETGGCDLYHMVESSLPVWKGG